MKEYKIVTVLWEDHTAFSRQEFPKGTDLSDHIRPSLTIGLLYKKYKKFIIVAYNIDRYETWDEADFMIIFSDSILSLQEHGRIKIEKLRNKGG